MDQGRPCFLVGRSRGATATGASARRFVRLPLGYIAGVTASPAFTARFAGDLSTPGLRVPLTADHDLFGTSEELGRRVIWLHTFGDRFADAGAGRPAGSPRLPADRAPKVPGNGVISTAPGQMPESLGYDPTKRRLRVGAGFVENVSPEMWAYEVSGMSVLEQWFSYRRSNRERPLIGDKRLPSQLEKIRPDRWLPEYTTDLLDVLNVLGLLIELEPQQASALEAICDGPTISLADLTEAGALALPDGYPTKPVGRPTPPTSAPQLFG